MSDGVGDVLLIEIGERREILNEAMPARASARIFRVPAVHRIYAIPIRASAVTFFAIVSQSPRRSAYEVVEHVHI